MGNARAICADCSSHSLEPAAAVRRTRNREQGVGGSERRGVSDLDPGGVGEQRPLRPTEVDRGECADIDGKISVSGVG